MRRTTLIAGLLGLAAVLTGCGLGEHNQDTVTYDVTDKVAGLRVEADSGTVEVIESDREGIHVSERLTWRKEKPKTTHAVRGDTLELSFTCPTSWGLGAAGVSCDVSYRVEVPKGLRVKAGTDSGDLTLTDLSGEIEATSDSGAIVAGGLTGKRLVARTDSGDMTLTFTGQPDKVTTTTDSGSTQIHVPRGPYNVVAKTDSGGKAITTDSDASAPRSIELTSDSGDLAVSTP
ncbi:DUF4097 domain-containing protein [Nonomuraea sp. PA05]|uniref:DUF4097 family beta strand repeat-containing protein n=1 Tax=Nonomuraea sp. PA05 TaxID=2604466 RepID=UPI0011D7AD83|nr:DUF4097 family beta strand repeat-containing protein [Nonomuraea sp. PA05]TYB67680.1 DUF4097 domain-containing protein [Nonomuraea sp. PA05]